MLGNLPQSHIAHHSVWICSSCEPGLQISHCASQCDTSSLFSKYVKSHHHKYTAKCKVNIVNTNTEHVLFFLILSHFERPVVECVGSYAQGLYTRVWGSGTY